MTVDHHKLSQVIAPVAADVTVVVSLLEQMNIALAPWYVFVDLMNKFVSRDIRKDHTFLRTLRIVLISVILLMMRYRF